ncbi:MAG: putative oxidoreductase [Pseudonocardiales bacterium]|nr:putative oxidoreductase [Pseudonocardiales bacterium]
MKVRIGVGISTSSADAMVSALADVVEFGFDSIWLPELLAGDAFDPLIALTWAGAAFPRLKLGTTMLLPGRNVVRLAKQLASLDALSAGRLLVTFVPGINVGAEGSAIGLPLAQRRAAMEDALPVLRALLSGQKVSHNGPIGSFDDIELTPLPVQQPLEFWLGGTAPRSLELCGRLGDGWLPSLLTPEEAVTGKLRIEEVAAEAGRTIDPEHFGVSIGYSRTPLSGPAYDRLVVRAGDGADMSRLVPVGPASLRGLLTEFIEAGFSKFVVRPSVSGSTWKEELEVLAASVLDLQT